jgi:hypothetical protein
MSNASRLQEKTATSQPDPTDLRNARQVTTGHPPLQKRKDGDPAVWVDLECCALALLRCSRVSSSRDGRVARALQAAADAVVENLSRRSIVFVL